ncbi:hypothetical protein [Nocardia donostiensis]|uniref:Uncharacterized protein n=2 Tax=Nocardia donostiensis TaxID=1538463 RepID=A0A1W0B6Z1_9NOCA|nr:hypothetical protein [Nocardia donostiensis]ONM46400.1 hypothetical protein B0T46_23140 [Nocardia donostiensis]OQS16309.1 hypothetical protein B0T36_05980 [Nocardia donostiensis]OQS18292.1 hypothetical protein B0T44_20395 [Nocardia donostiensis]
MSSEPTRAAALDQLYGHLQRTLGVLPGKPALSLVHPAIPQARLHRGVTLPYRADDPDDTTEFFDIAYWVVGIAPDAVGACFDRVVRTWIEAGWPTRTDRDAPPRSAFTRTPDRFGLSVRESVDAYLSLSGSTPPFVPGGPVGDPFPESISHPS